jgi:hypothetical protein
MVKRDYLRKELKGSNILEWYSLRWGIHVATAELEGDGV